MPYGIPEEKPEQTTWMDRCVDSITGTNKRTGKSYTEGDKIAICKSNLKKHGWKVPKIAEEEIKIDLECGDEVVKESNHVHVRRLTKGMRTI